MKKVAESKFIPKLLPPSIASNIVLYFSIGSKISIKKAICKKNNKKNIDKNKEYFLKL